MKSSQHLYRRGDDSGPCGEAHGGGAVPLASRHAAEVDCGQPFAMKCSSCCNGSVYGLRVGSVRSIFSSRSSGAALGSGGSSRPVGSAHTERQPAYLRLCVFRRNEHGKAVVKAC